MGISLFIFFYRITDLYKRKGNEKENKKRNKISFPIFQIVGSIFDVQGKTYSVRPEFFIS
jgi:hypothetical protein